MISSVNISTDPTHQASLILPTLPPEIHVLLFEFLDFDTSTCLGLTCHNFYEIHKKTKTKMNRGLLCERAGPFQPWSNLPTLLATWMGTEFTYEYNYSLYFVKHRRLETLKEEWASVLQDCDIWLRSGNTARFSIGLSGMWDVQGPGRIESEDATSLEPTLMKGLRISLNCGQREWIHGSTDAWNPFLE